MWKEKWDIVAEASTTSVLRRTYTITTAPGWFALWSAFFFIAQVAAATSAVAASVVVVVL